MARMQDYRNLVAWQKGHLLALAVHRALRARRGAGYPGLGARILRAAASVPTNIAEGCSRRSRTDFCRFLDMAIASASELDYHLLLARDIGMLGAADYEALAEDCAEVRRVLHGLIRGLRRVELVR